MKHSNVGFAIVLSLLLSLFLLTAGAWAQQANPSNPGMRDFRAKVVQPCPPGTYEISVGPVYGLGGVRICQPY